MSIILTRNTSHRINLNFFLRERSFLGRRCNIFRLLMFNVDARRGLMAAISLNGCPVGVIGSKISLIIVLPFKLAFSIIATVLTNVR